MNIIAAILSGLFLSVIFPTVVRGTHFPDLSALAWVALVPVLWVCRRSAEGGLRGVTLYGFLTSLIYNGLVSYWIFHAMYVYGELSAAASLAGVLAMATIMGGIQTGAFVLAFGLTRKARLPLLIAFPLCWTVCEWLRNYGPFGGYPWSQLAYSQAGAIGGSPLLIQSADLFGVYGLTFLIVFVNVVVFQLSEFLARARKFPTFGVSVAILLSIANFAYGTWRMQTVSQESKSAKTLSVALVQPNIAQDIKWHPAQAARTVQILSDLTDQAVERGADLVIWPESAYPDIVPTNLSQLDELAKWDIPLLTGVVSMRLEMQDDVRDEPRLHNSAVQINAGGNLNNFYHKFHLVPLGEYVPLKNMFGFLDKIVPSIGDFLPGTKREPLQVGAYGRTPLRYGVTICYEDLFPEISRAFVERGADFLTNITNDAWYGDSSAPWQHIVFSQFRAIENRRAMVRSTNTGVTAAIDPTGHILGQLPAFTKDVLVADIPLGGAQTLYTRFGDVLWLGLLGLVLAISALIQNIRKSD